MTTQSNYINRGRMITESNRGRPGPEPVDDDPVPLRGPYATGDPAGDTAANAAWLRRMTNLQAPPEARTLVPRGPARQRNLTGPQALAELMDVRHHYPDEDDA